MKRAALIRSLPYLAFVGWRAAHRDEGRAVQAKALCACLSSARISQSAAEHGAVSGSMWRIC